MENEISKKMKPLNLKKISTPRSQKWSTKKINIEIDEKISEGIHSNLAIINHSASEFVMDFISIMPGSTKNKVKSRIIITPQHAKKLRKALNDNIEKVFNYSPYAYFMLQCWKRL